MPQAKVNNINLAYKVRGDGQPIVMITGFASAQNTLFRLARAFAKHYHVITFDSRNVKFKFRAP
jgi:pimeloyl-ACP methyl ester carboxylesterase